MKKIWRLVLVAALFFVSIACTIETKYGHCMNNGGTAETCAHLEGK